MPQQTIGEMGLRMFNDAKAAISMGKMDGLLRPVRHLELRVKYCQHLHKTRKLSITHWKGEENPSDGLTKSLKPLSLWTNLVEAVGLVPGPTDQEGDKQLNFVEYFKTFWLCHSWYPRRGVKFHPFAVHDIIIFSFLIVSSFILSWKHLHVMHVENWLW